MKKVGIKVWVLTGDKVETAMTIGVAAGLLDASMLQHPIVSADEAGLRRALERIKKDIADKHTKDPSTKQAIIVAGASLAVI